MRCNEGVDFGRAQSYVSSHERYSFAGEFSKGVQPRPPFVFLAYQSFPKTVNFSFEIKILVQFAELGSNLRLVHDLFLDRTLGLLLASSFGLKL